MEALVTATGTVVLPRRVRKQPQPLLVEGGDCGACVLGGALGISPAAVYRMKGERKTISTAEMLRLLELAVDAALADRIAIAPAFFRTYPRSFLSARAVALAWFKFVRTMIDGGYYGIAEVSLEQDSGKAHGTDHWVLICGARVIDPSQPDESLKLRPGRRHVVKGGPITDNQRAEVLVSCSARRSNGKAEWVEVQEFLERRGGLDLIAVRPTVQERRPGRPVIDLVGKRFERLVVIERAGSERGSSVWVCLCDCGNEITASCNHLAKGSVRSCGCLARDFRRANGRIYGGKNRLPAGEAALTVLINRYQSAARQRSLSWELDRDQARRLFLSQCAYCNSGPVLEVTGSDSASVLRYNGIDRIDNNIGYLLDNCVACCFVCNHAKSVMSRDDFLRWVGRVYRYQSGAIPEDDGRRIVISRGKR